MGPPCGVAHYIDLMGFDDDWRINRLTLLNYRCFRDLSLDFTAPVTVMVGINGSGKTAVLDALAVMLATVVKELGGESEGFKERDARVVAADLRSVDAVATLEPVFPVRAEVEATLSGRTFTWDRVLESERGRTTLGSVDVRRFVRSVADRARRPTGETSGLPVVAYYGVERLIKVRRADGHLRASRSSAYAATLNPNSDLTRLSEFLESLASQITNAIAFGDAPPRAALAQFAAIENACEIVLASTGWSRPRWNPVTRELTLTDESGETLPLSWMASGIRIAAGLAIDLSSRMARANPHLGSGDLLSRTPGIVMIDEVDLHLHPIWQQRIVPSLAEAFPRVQFILTTHSPQVLSTIEAENIRILNDSRVRVPEHSAGLRSDVVLQKIQGTKPEPDTQQRRQLDRYIDLVYANQGTSPVARSMRSMVEEAMGGIENVPELADADAYMAVEDLEF